MRNMARLRVALALIAGLALVALVPTPASGATNPTVWLCRPGARPDPCTPSLTTTRLSPTGRVLGVDHLTANPNPSIDCFYVYPTVSDQKTPNANLNIDPEERSIALYQVAYYSRYCRVYAPMYRQLTISAIGGAPNANAAMAYGDVRDAWLNYLKAYNRGRGVVLIGHSQGSFMLRQLIAKEIDPNAAVRKRLVSAILLGGNVTVRQGQGIGGDFQHIPACTAATQVGCVIAFSTFNVPPPPNAFFGRTSTPGLQVLCTNPASLAGGTGVLNPVFPSQPFAPGTSLGGAAQATGSLPTASTPWIEAPGSYTAACLSTSTTNVLEITPQAGAPTLRAVLGPTWGLHLVDANIALGNLTAIVNTEAIAYARRHH
jgi:Protein of unknown function (DUF3089)